MSNRSPSIQGFCFFALLSFFVLVGSSGYAQEQETVPMYKTELERLIVISARLETLNGRLKSELKTSKNSLQEHMIELSSLRIEAENLRKELSSLKAQLQESLTESQELKEALTKAESSLASLEESFELYKKEIQGEINRLKWQRNAAVVAAAIVTVLNVSLNINF